VVQFSTISSIANSVVKLSRMTISHSRIVIRRVLAITYVRSNHEHNITQHNISFLDFGSLDYMLLG